MIRYPGQGNLFPGAVEHGTVLVTSGVIAPGVLAGETLSLEDEVRGALDELKRIVGHAQLTLEAVMRVEAFIADRDQFAVWNDLFVTYWPDQRQRPARSTMVVGFVLPTMNFEVQALVASSPAPSVSRIKSVETAGNGHS